MGKTKTSDRQYSERRAVFHKDTPLLPPVLLRNAVYTCDIKTATELCAKAGLRRLVQPIIVSSESQALGRSLCVPASVTQESVKGVKLKPLERNSLRENVNAFYILQFLVSTEKRSG